MSIEEDVITGSHTEDHELQDDHDTPSDNIYAAFGIDKSEEKQDEPPANEDVKVEPKTIRVKVDKEEREFDASDDKIPEYIQKAYALDRERERKSELEKNLDRAAKLAGYTDHAAYVADLDKLEQQQQQKEANAHNELLTQLREQAEDAGLDPDQVEQYLTSHPLVKEAERIRQEREAEVADKAKAKSLEEANLKWKSLYEAYPNLVESSKAFEEGQTPEWYNSDMQSRIAKGYDPIDAYELAHRDKITAQTKQQTAQRIIKETQLGLRSKVETTSDPDNEPSIPAAHASAFAAFGLPVEAARKYIKK